MLVQGLPLLPGICRYWPLCVHSIRIVVFCELGITLWCQSISQGGAWQKLSPSRLGNDPMRTRRKVMIYSHRAGAVNQYSMPHLPALSCCRKVPLVSYRLLRHFRDFRHKPILYPTPPLHFLPTLPRHSFLLEHNPYNSYNPIYPYYTRSTFDERDRSPKRP